MRKKTTLFFVLWFIIISLEGCSTQEPVRKTLFKESQKPKEITVNKRPEKTPANYIGRRRQPIPFDALESEGSLWSNNSRNWGNLFRDQRAQFVGELVEITAVQNARPTFGADPTEDTTKRFPDRTNQIERSIQTIQAQIIKKLRNDNFLIQAKKILYTDSNTFQYVTTISGKIRSEDINENNQIDAKKMADFQMSTTRRIRRGSGGSSLSIGADGVNFNLQQ